MNNTCKPCSTVVGIKGNYWETSSLCVLTVLYEECNRKNEEAVKRHMVSLLASFSKKLFVKLSSSFFNSNIKCTDLSFVKCSNTVERKSDSAFILFHFWL